MADVLQGAGTGATAGAAIGSVIPGIGTAIGGAGGAIIGALLSGLMGSKNEPTPIQAQQKQLLDQLLSGLKGEGQFANLFSTDQAAFQKSFVDPAKQMFKGQIAPQIQQSYIASGQQRGTGMEDTLARAGVDLDQLLNQNFMNFQQNAQNRQTTAIGSILGQGAGAPEQIGYGKAAMQGLAGYMSGDRFGNDIGNITQSFMNQKNQTSQRLIDRKAIQDQISRRKGFESTSTMAG